MEENLGAQIKQQRAAQGLTLNELSELSGLSISYLSQVERGIVPASLEALGKIAAALDVTSNKLLDFSNCSEPQDGIFYSYETEVLPQPEQGFFYELSLSKQADLSMDSFTVTLLPARGNADYRFQPPAGVEGFAYVLDGTVKVDTGEKTYYLNVGDCISYAKHKKTAYYNETRRLARLLFVCMGQSGR